MRLTYVSLFCYGARGNITAYKWVSTSWGYKSWWSGTPSIPPASNYYVRINPDLSMWVDEQINGENVKVYYHDRNSPNKCDFILYHYTDSR